MDSRPTEPSIPSWLEPLSHQRFAEAARFAHDLRTAGELVEAAVVADAGRIDLAA